MKKIVSFFFLLIFRLLGNEAEIEYNKNSVFIELLGNGLLYSVNYERHINLNSSIRLGGMGFTSNFVWGENRKIAMFPLMYNHFKGKTNYKFEISIGLVIGFASWYAENQDI